MNGRAATNPSAILRAVEGLRSVVAAEAGRPSTSEESGRPHLVLGVTTFNRRQYIERFLESFMRTRSQRFRWTLIIADDGSTDRTVEYCRSIDGNRDVSIHVIENRGVGVAGQTNAILHFARTLHFDFGFKADDDIWFDAEGWDELYYDAMLSSGMDHLVFHDPDYRAPAHEVRRDDLVSSVDVMSSMGCFWTFSPSLIDSVGYFDEREFRIRGHAHIDYTMRACRAGSNVAETLFDAQGSHLLIKLQSRVGYIQTFDWQSAEAKAFFTAAERARREAVIKTPDRQFVGFDPLRSDDPVLWSRDPWSSSTPQDFSTYRPKDSIPEALVLNLARTPGRWTTTAGVLAGVGLRFERILGVDGGAEPILHDWQRYNALGPQSDRERKLGRRLLASPGALGYLHSVKKAIARARERRLEAFILFDDDVYPHRDAAVLLGTVMAELPRRWKLLHLGGRQTDWQGATRIADHLYRAEVPPLGSYALAIHASAYDDLEREIVKFDSPFDDEPIADIWRRYPDEVFVAWPPVFLPDVSSSLIRASRSLAELSVGAQWNPEDYLIPDRSDARLHPRVSIVLWGKPGRHDDLRRSSDGWRQQTEPSLEVLSVLLPGQKIADDRLRALMESDGRLAFLEPEDPRSPTHEIVNAALSVATGEWVLLGDSRSWAHESLVVDAITEMQERGLGIGFLPHVHVGENLMALDQLRRAVWIGPRSNGRMIMLRREALDQLGGLNETELAGNDLLIRRARGLGIAHARLHEATMAVAGREDRIFSSDLDVTMNPTARADALTAVFTGARRDAAGRIKTRLRPVHIGESS